MSESEIETLLKLSRERDTVLTKMTEAMEAHCIASERNNHRNNLHIRRLADEGFRVEELLYRASVKLARFSDKLGKKYHVTSPRSLGEPESFKLFVQQLRERASCV
jgi:hypothetical protein